VTPSRPGKGAITRRPAFWLIIILVVVIPVVAFVSAQLLGRALRTPLPARPPSSLHGARQADAGGIPDGRPRTVLS